MSISREELEKLTAGSVDPNPLGRIARPYDNVNLTDKELVQKIRERNKDGKPTTLLRFEYERRLMQREL